MAESRNPFLRRELGDQGYATFNPAPSQTATVDAAGAQTTPQQLQEMYDRTTTGQRMTIDDVVVKTSILFLILLAGATVGWVAGNSLLTFGSMIAALVLGLMISFKRTVNVPAIAAYALLEGVFLGGISLFYQDYVDQASETGDGPNIVLQAVLGTLVAFGVMLALYKTGRLRATPKFQKMFMVALFSYLGIAVVSLISALFGVGGGWGFYGVGPLGIALCALGVALASFSLVLDFDAIEQGINVGLPEPESWRMGFGLMVTLVWLYLELLRLLAILNSSD
ncbi:MAG: Bax inhibitor-1/YccA family protein [Candidatus Nanopelagicales bacterium]